MAKLLVNTTHSMFFFENQEEQEKAEKILEEKFSARDSRLKYSKLVKIGLKSDIVSFYIKDKRLLPTGFLPFVIYLFKKNNINLEIHDKRIFAEYDLSELEKPLGEIKVKDFQKEAVKTAVEKKMGIIYLPTGSGKSVVLALLTKVYKNVKILCLFDNIDLIYQTYNLFTKKYGFSNSEIGIIQGNNFDDSKRITLLSIKSYEKAFHLFPEIKVIISDEVHKTGRNPTSEHIIYCCQNAANRFGLTATPFLDNEVERLKMYGLMSSIIYKQTLEKKIKDGTLANVKIKMLKIGENNSIPIKGKWKDIYEYKRITSKTKVEEYLQKGYELDKNKKILKKFIEYGDESLHYVYNEHRNKIIAQEALKYFKQYNKRVLVFFSIIEHGKFLLNLIPNAILISGTSTLQEREEAKKLLKENKNIILASSIWFTGVDIPEVEVLINAAGQRGFVVTVQKLGRGTRKSQNIDKNEVLIIDFYDNYSPLSIKQSKRRFNIYKNLKLNVSIEELK